MQDAIRHIQEAAWIATVFGTLVGLTTFLVARRYYARTLIGKLHDRILDLNKLSLQYPKVPMAFFANAKRVDPYFDAPESAVPRNEDFYLLRAYVYFRLNVYEEAYYATQGIIVSRFKQAEAWKLDCAPLTGEKI